MQAELIDNVKHEMITFGTYFLSNRTYNFGAGTIDRLGSVQVVGSSSVLSVNANTNTGLLPSSGSVPIPGSSFLVSVNGADNCGSHAIVLVGNSGKLIIGEITPNNIGILEVRDAAAVEIRNTGSLTVNKNSELHIKAGGTLVIHSGATFNLDGKLTIDPGAYFCIEQGAIVNVSSTAIQSISPSYIPGANPVDFIATNNCTPKYSCPGEPYNLSNEALQFDGIDDYVEIPETNGKLNLGTGDFTIEAFIKANKNNDIQVIVSKRTFASGATADGFMFGIWLDGHLWAQLEGSPNLIDNSNNYLTDGKCHHVAMVRNGTLVNFYIDGNLLNYYFNSGRNISSTGSLRIGHNHISNLPFNGIIGEVRIWNAAVTPSMSPVNPSSPNLVGYWDMTGPSSDYLADLSVNGNTGMLGSTPSCDANDPIWVDYTSLPCTVGGNFKMAASGSNTTVSGTSNDLVSLYPNPFLDKLTLDLPETGGDVSIKLTNAEGKVIYAKEHCQSSEVLNLGDEIPSGFYFMEVTSSSYKNVFKVLKVK